jgi:phage terminase small subunit
MHPEAAANIADTGGRNPDHNKGTEKAREHCDDGRELVERPHWDRPHEDIVRGEPAALM